MKRISLLLFIAIGLSQAVNGQSCDGNSYGCSISAPSPYPTSTFSTTSSSWQSVSQFMNGGNFTLFNVTCGNTYEWSYCSDFSPALQNFNAEITLFDNNNNFLCYQNNSGRSNCPNAPYLSWPATYTGVVKLLTTSSTTLHCQSNSGSTYYSSLVWRQSSQGQCPAPPNTPTGLTASSTSSSSIYLSWNITSGATSYDIYDCNNNYVDNTANNYYTKNGLSSSTYYSYKILARNSYGSSGFTTCKGATTQSVITNPSISLSGNLSFGNVQVGNSSTKTLTITNTGNATLNVSSINLPSGFTGNYNGSITTGNSQNITITFSPSSAITYGGTITVNSNASSGSNTISCSGTGTTISAPAISLSGNLSFGNVQIGNSSTKTLTITNTGNATLNVSSINLPSGFTGNYNGSITAGNSKNVTITFSPTSTTTYGGTITVNSNASSGTNTISCSGTGTTVSAPAISLSGNLSFGNCTVGLTYGKILTITNTGTSTLNVSNITAPTGFSVFWALWSGSLSPGNSVNLDVLFTPTSTSTYGGTITIVSNATSGTNTISCSGNGVPASQVTVKIVNFNSALPTIPIASASTNQAIDRLKICADGSNATEITFVNNSGVNNNNIRFRVASDPNGNGNDVGKSGFFIRDLENLSINGNTINAKFTHPNYLEEQYKPYRNDSIKIVDITNPNLPIYTIPMQIYRAPVVMVHGFTGGGYDEAFKTTRDFLNIAGGYYGFDDFLKVLDYHKNSLKSFENNKDEVPKGIVEVLTSLRNYKFSCGKVNLVGFSMGGCLSRQYLQSTEYSSKNDINKLITINTPHFGSQWANLALNIRASGLAYEAMVTLIKANDIVNNPNNIITLNYGAIRDLSVNSDALVNGNNALNKLPNFNRNKVATHCITTTASSFDLWYEGTMYYTVFKAAAIANGYLSLNNFNNHVFFGYTNDGIVATPSQNGGLDRSFETRITNQFHLNSNKNYSVMTELENALNKNANDNTYFTKDGFDNSVTQNSYYRLQALDTVNKIQDGSISINYPLRGQSFNPNSLVPVNITSSNGINQILFAGISTFENVTNVDTSMSNGIINYRIPSNAFGTIKLLVLGYDSNGLVGHDTVTININQTASLDSINTSSQPIYVQVSNTASISLNAYFNDGNVQEVSYLNDVQYEVADTTYAKYFYGNTIYGKEIGTTTLTATYQGLSIEIPVIVIPRDTTLKIVSPEIVTKIINIIKNNRNLLKLFPNPTTGEFTLQANVETGEQIRIEVFNQSGQSVLLKEDKSTNKNYTKNINLSQFSSGVYYIVLSTKTTSYTNKILLTK